MITSPFRTSILSAGIALAAAVTAHGAVLLDENFEGLVLAPFESATESGGDGTDWTSTTPAGWTRDNGSTPVGSPAEFFGFTFLDKNSWIATEGDQERSQFVLGSGTVMVADPDAYDDGTDIDTGLFNAYMSTSPISLLGVAANSINVQFDSSFRAEETQIAVLDVSYDGGTSYTNLLTYDGAVVPDQEKINEHLSFDLNNPESGDLVVRFGLVNASNDWWWAVDNVKISDGGAVPEPSTALLLSVSAFGALARRRRR
ncbi:MAG: PEP-CTERM sorting domain-containing protein [Verrucomicrobiae bacterium]|nr:PEP-CTERM sorting domain-containing protein [Verrucomicrobiae bacterium]